LLNHAPVPGVATERKRGKQRLRLPARLGAVSPELTSKGGAYQPPAKNQAQWRTPPFLSYNGKALGGLSASATAGVAHC
jgi:hypothetical protein